MKIQEWIGNKFSDIATRLPSLVHEDPASFACGYNMGYKQALLDFERELEDESER